MSDIERRTDRLAALRERVERLPGYEGELGTHVLAASPERLMERSPKTAARRIDAVNMATVYGERTDGCGSVGCLAALAIIDCPEEAAATRRRIAGDDNLPERAVSMLDIAARILGLDPATRDALFCGVGSEVVRGPRRHAEAGHTRRPRPHDGGSRRRRRLEAPRRGAPRPLIASRSRPTPLRNPPRRPPLRRP